MFLSDSGIPRIPNATPAERAARSAPATTPVSPPRTAAARPAPPARPDSAPVVSTAASVPARRPGKRLLLALAKFSELFAIVLLVGLSVGTFALTGSIWAMLLVFFGLPTVIIAVPVMQARRQD
jgi:hypothetical protein